MTLEDCGSVDVGAKKTLKGCRQLRNETLGIFLFS